LSPEAGISAEIARRLRVGASAVASYVPSVFGGKVDLPAPSRTLAGDMGVRRYPSPPEKKVRREFRLALSINPF